MKTKTLNIERAGERASGRFKNRSITQSLTLSLLFLCLTSMGAFAADNLIGLNIYKAGTTANPILRATENGDGTYTMHVVLDSGGSGGGGAVTQSGNWDIRNITGTVSLPTGAATSSNQATANTSLSTIATNTTPQVTSAGGAYVRQDSTATMAKETGGNLATIKTNTDKIPTLGENTPANAVPVIQATATTVASSALETSHVMKASSGRLVSLHWLNTKTSAQYLLIMNSTTVPSDGAVTLLYPPIYMPATSNGSLTFPTPLTASTGISVSNSSTGTFTKTIGSADCIFVAQVQ